ncbi:pantoate--beta-alanine ligase [Metabacillus arenae]|uniref:Pantothenate synthetase n=1 Tax=Metabacillus arenae TaxID=2771434 RepID=A0A926NJ20_9BACI|nr:pantoate--beta-alanine ligase [Metabacillus arenae]MBD1381675.1 pantoate--beta-alanine ligase [Metabacillus arenae]
MKTISTIKEIQNVIKEIKSTKKKIGFVPTMGFLHDGHLSLMEQASRENDCVIVSIFVNPLQFGQNEDFDSYPRDIERDQFLAEKAGVHYLFVPSVTEMYPSKPSIEVKAKDRVDVLCGKSRPGHFDGVVTILTKLFHIIQPDRAYFGKKDAQQVAVVEGLINDLHFPVTLVPVPTIRETDGLAKSSRNVKLSDKERNQAPRIYHSLLQAKSMIKKGERSVGKIISVIKNDILENTDGNIDYVEILSYPELKKLNELKGTIIVAVAVHFVNARLIDNITLELN